MAKTHKLKSGNRNCVVYSHTETIMQPDGTKKEKRIYKSFTCDIPGPQGNGCVKLWQRSWQRKKEHIVAKDRVEHTRRYKRSYRCVSSRICP